MNEIKDIELICPYCNITLNKALALNGPEGPEEGDISICATCGEISTFNNSLQLEKLNEEKMKIFFQDDPEVWSQLKSISKEIKDAKIKQN